MPFIHSRLESASAQAGPSSPVLYKDRQKLFPRMNLSMSRGVVSLAPWVPEQMVIRRGERTWRLY